MVSSNTKAPAATEALYQNTDDKQFYTLRAKFAMGGHVLTRSNPADGKITYFCSKWGMCRQFNELAGVSDYLKQIGGAV